MQSQSEKSLQLSLLNDAISLVAKGCEREEASNFYAKNPRGLLCLEKSGIVVSFRQIFSPVSGMVLAILETGLFVFHRAIGAVA